MYYWTCPECGANLDFNEKCDCENNKNIKEVQTNVRNQNHSSGVIRSNQQPC